MFEVKKKADRSSIITFTIIAAFFFIVWLYLFIYDNNSGEVCSSEIAFLVVAGFLALIAFGLSIPTTVRISDESIMLLRGTSISGEAMLDDIEKVVVRPGGDMKIEIYAGGERRLSINDVDIGADGILSLRDELKRISEKHHFPVIEKESSLEHMKEGTSKNGAEDMPYEETSDEYLSGDGNLPYRVK